MDFDVENLRLIESEAIAKLSAKAKSLRESDPTLNPGIARARACASMPQTTNRYLDAVQRLTYAGHAPKVWK
jgi:hypothetical protein